MIPERSRFSLTGKREKYMSRVFIVFASGLVFESRLPTVSNIRKQIENVSIVAEEQAVHKKWSVCVIASLWLWQKCWAEAPNPPDLHELCALRYLAKQRCMKSHWNFSCTYRLQSSASFGHFIQRLSCSWRLLMWCLHGR